MNFFWEIESCVTEIQYQVTRRRHFKKIQTKESGLRDPKTLEKIETPRHLRIKRRLRDAHNRLKNETARPVKFD